MYALRFALKRSLCRPMFLLLLAVYAITIVLAGTAGKQAAMPPAGVFDAGNTVASQRICSYLTENGFVVCKSAEDAEEQVRSGALDCAVILPEDLLDRLAADQAEGSVPWIISPSSFVPDLYKDHVAAAIYREHAPHLTAALFEGTPISKEEALFAYETMFQDGYAFSFDLHTVGEATEPADLKQQSAVMGVSAILLCVLVFSFCVDLVISSFQETVGRLGLRQVLSKIVIPGLLVRLLAAVAAGWIALATVGLYELMLPLLLHGFILAGTGLLLAALLQNARHLYILLSILTVGAIALCPIYADLTFTFPVLIALRFVLPAYWLWLLPDHAMIGVIAAVLASAAGIGGLILRYTVLRKYRLKKD